MTKITLITTTFFSESTILDTLLSVNQQTYKDIEHLIIDSTSTDGTLSIIKQYGKRVSKVISEPDRGIYDAYNKGLSVASGDIIGFLNSDDFYCNDEIIEKVMSIFKDTTIEACYGDLVYVDKKNVNKITRYWRSRPYRQGIFKKAFVPAHPTLFLRKSVYEKAGYFNLNYKFASDYEFMLRIFHQFSVRSVYIPEIMVKMRTGGATGASLSNIWKQNKEIVQALTQQGVPYSIIQFMAYKVLNRLLQRASVYYKPMKLAKISS